MLFNYPKNKLNNFALYKITIIAKSFEGNHKTINVALKIIPTPVSNL